MSWLRIDDRFPRHRKVAPLSDAAFRLHVTAMAECCESGTDGRVGPLVPPTLTRAPHGRALARALGELEAAGLWHALEDGGWQIHDFLDWNLSAADSRLLRDARAAAGRRGGQRSGEQRRSKVEAKSEALASVLVQQSTKQNEANPNPVPEPEETTTAEADASAPQLVPLETLLGSDPAEEHTAHAREKQRACRLPKDFPLTGALRKIATDLGCRNPEAMHAAFVDYWRGTGRPMLDWTATYRRWARDGHCGNPGKACACLRQRRGLDAVQQVAEEWGATGRVPA